MDQFPKKKHNKKKPKNKQKKTPSDKWPYSNINSQVIQIFEKKQPTQREQKQYKAKEKKKIFTEIAFASMKQGQKQDKKRST